MILVGTIRSLSLQMAFAQRFNEVTCDITHISSLAENRKYPIEHADSVTTRFGETILLSIRDVTADLLCKVFLPQLYTAVFKDDDVLAINDGFASGIWFRRVDVRIRTHINWLLSRIILLFRCICPWPKSTQRFQISFSRTCGHYPKN